LRELGLQGVDSLLIGRHEGVRGCGHGEGADDEEDAEGPEQVRLAVD
jgi:hypothetical protein